MGFAHIPLGSVRLIVFLLMTFDVFDADVILRDVSWTHLTGNMSQFLQYYHTM
jgi:hypothetical protein